MKLALAAIVCFLSVQEKPPQSETVALEKPIEPRLNLVLEDAYRPGTKVKIEDYKGKIVLLRAAVPE